MPFLLCAMAARIGCPAGASYSGTQCLALRRAQNSLGRVLAFVYLCRFCYAPMAARVGLPHKGQAIRARSALRPQGAKLLRARARLPIYHGLFVRGFFVWRAVKELELFAACGKLFGHAVPCARRGAKLLRRVLAFIYLCRFCYAPIAARIGCPIRGKLFGHAVPCARRAQNSLGRVLAFVYLCRFCYAPMAARIGCPAGASYSGTQCLAPAGRKTP